MQICSTAATVRHSHLQSRPLRLQFRDSLPNSTLCEDHMKASGFSWKRKQISSLAPITPADASITFSYPNLRTPAVRESSNS